jgi:hypothetical protein
LFIVERDGGGQARITPETDSSIPEFGSASKKSTYEPASTRVKLRRAVRGLDHTSG